MLQSATLLLEDYDGRPSTLQNWAAAMDDRAIGIFDSGIGGLTVVREIQRLLPSEALIYLGDTARVPYGTKTRHTVTRYADQVARTLLDQDVKMLVVACNTASAQALDALDELYAESDGPPPLGIIQGRKAVPTSAQRSPLPIVGVIDPGARTAVETTRTGRIGVIGTEGTIRNGAYERAIAQLNPDIEVCAEYCPLFVSLAEEGWIEGQVVELVAERYLAPVRKADVDTLILGCTHYPLLRKVIQQVIGEDVTLVDSAPATARQVQEVLARTGREAAPDAPGGIRFQATDSPQRFRAVGSRFLQEAIDQVELVDL